MVPPDVPIPDDPRLLDTCCDVVIRFKGHGSYEGGRGSQMVNYFDEGSWSKLPVPLGDRVRLVSWDGTHFVFETEQCLVRSMPAQLKASVLDSMTERGLTEEMIARNFGEVDASVPPDCP